MDFFHKKKEVAGKRFQPILKCMFVAHFTRLMTALAIVVAILSVYALENARSSVTMDRVMLGETPATFYAVGPPSGALVVVAHGFGGSRQMMEAISLTLASTGHTVVAFDFIGHGRHLAPLSPAIETLTGTTQDLVEQTIDVVQAAQRRTGLVDVSFVGHSMATDVVVRAAQSLDATEAVVAISMYSDAVTPTHPEQLLIVSGAFENRLRAIALDAVAQIGPAQEGETVKVDDIARRAASAPLVGHVGVLWSHLTLTEISAWLGTRKQPMTTGPWIAALLGAVVVLFHTLTRLLPKTVSTLSPRAVPGSLGRVLLAAGVGAIGAGVVATTGLPLMGLAGFGGLGLAFGIWGFLVLLILRRPLRLSGLDLAAGLVLVVWGLGVFAIALDRYGAAFLPTGPRLTLALVLLPATAVFAVADRSLVQGHGLFARIALRIPFLLTFTLAMIVSPSQLGLVFTVLPVMVLFWLVYGTMAMWVTNRTGPIGAGLGSGLILAWAIATSTPLFMA
jgi:pimeloyl-ACP methyl ester carboxylesterase